MMVMIVVVVVVVSRHRHGPDGFIFWGSSCLADLKTVVFITLPRVWFKFWLIIPISSDYLSQPCSLLHPVTISQYSVSDRYNLIWVTGPDSPNVGHTRCDTETGDC